MLKKALVIIDIQNDITKNYKEIIDNINKSIDCVFDKIEMQQKRTKSAAGRKRG